MPIVLLATTSSAWRPQCPPTHIPMADASIRIPPNDEVRYFLTVPSMNTLYVLNAMRELICSAMLSAFALTVHF